MTMKILLINPPQSFAKGSQDFSAGIPVGLLLLAAVLREDGFSVALLDALISDFQIVREPGGLVRYGMSWDDMARRVKELAPDLVGIAAPFSAQEHNCISAVATVKGVFPRVPVVVGGPHISVRYREFMDQVQLCDFAVRGEGELTLLELARSLRDGRAEDLKGICGLSYREHQVTVHNPNRPWIMELDRLPLPAYELADMDAYLNPGNRYLYASRHGNRKREAPLITSRGCPFSCIFCSIHSHMGRRWRGHSAQYVIRHLELLVRRYGVEHLHFEDDNLTLDQERFSAILDGILDKGLQITWDTPNGVRADTLDRELLVKAKRSGLRLLSIAVESGSQRVLDQVIGKKLSLEKVLQVARECRSLDIPLRAFFVIGFPGERVAEMKETLRLGLRLKREYRVDWSFLVATPLFGTRLYQICRENHYFTREVTPLALGQATMENGEFLIQTGDFTPRQIRRIILTRKIAFTAIKARRFLSDPMKYCRLILRHPSYIRP